jgi:hypothetical protein
MYSSVRHWLGPVVSLYNHPRPSSYTHDLVRHKYPLSFALRVYVKALSFWVVCE